MPKNLGPPGPVAWRRLGSQPIGLLARQDHSPGAPQCLAYGKGHLVAAFGWGAAGSLRETETGSAWREVKTNGGGFGGIAWAGDRFLAFEGCVTGIQTLTGSLVVVTGYDGIGDLGRVKRVAVSSNQGVSWTVGPIGDCVRAHQSSGGVAYGNGTVISVGAHGVVCRSTDLGKTWSQSGKAGGTVHSVIWDGQRFYAAAGARAFVSSDGETWQTLALTDGVSVHLVSRAPNGTYAAIAPDGRQYFRSTDGQRWTIVTGPSGLPFRHMAFGYGRRSGCL